VPESFAKVETVCYKIDQAYELDYRIARMTVIVSFQHTSGTVLARMKLRRA
jgi:hypothetical protein